MASGWTNADCCQERPRPTQVCRKSRSSINAQNEDQEQREKTLQVRPGGTVKRGQAFKRHILTKKTTKNKRHLRGDRHGHETRSANGQMLPFAAIPFERVRRN